MKFTKLSVRRVRLIAAHRSLARAACSVSVLIPFRDDEISAAVANDTRMDTRSDQLMNLDRRLEIDYAKCEASRFLLLMEIEWSDLAISEENSALSAPLIAFSAASNPTISSRECVPRNRP